MRGFLFTIAVLFAAFGFPTAAARAEGALVVATNINGQGGFWWNFGSNVNTSAEAQAQALAVCHRNPQAANCTVVATFRNSCSSVAFTAGGGYGYAGGRNAVAAGRAALAACQAHNPGIHCYVRETVCDSVDEQELQRAEAERLEAEQQQRAEEEARETARRQRLAELEQARDELRRTHERLQQQAREQREQLAQLERERQAKREQIEQAAQVERERQAREEQRQREAYETNLTACEQYDLAACVRISSAPLVVPGMGMAPQLDAISTKHMRFNRALEEARSFRTYLTECGMHKKRFSCDAALAMPRITSEQRTQVQQMQVALPLFNLDDPKHFISAMFAVPIFGYALFLLLARRTASGPFPLGDDPRPLDRLVHAARQHARKLPTPSISNLRARLAHLIAPRIPVAEPSGSSVSAPSTSEEPLREPPLQARPHDAAPPICAHEPLRDPATAQAALTLAHSYLSELPEQLASEIIDNPETAPTHRSTLALAAKQLDIARRADPTAKLSVENNDEPSTTFSQQWLRARTIQLEALTWCVQDPRREIRLLTQATQVDPSFAPAQHSLGAAHFLSRNRGPAIAALQQALALDPGNIEIIKLLDRARNVSDAEIATYHLSNAASKTVASGIKTWNILRLIWIFGLPIGIVLIVAQFTGSMSSSVGYIVGFFVLSAAFTGLRRLKHWFDTY